MHGIDLVLCWEASEQILQGSAGFDRIIDLQGTAQSKDLQKTLGSQRIPLKSHGRRALLIATKDKRYALTPWLNVMLKRQVLRLKQRNKI